ncbi:hypothetical protein CAEBREN_04730 [Caenorhabditis brenneri]|uniref:Uncharacterized protein n=1 Tax=Caenorhabditis brenneri TaxID=135651 RepID=G0NT33_CAEBE|nr:hypothetical protein CAEBREN_04730 [Caenorhabditis brenneri]
MRIRLIFNSSPFQHKSLSMYNRKCPDSLRSRWLNVLFFIGSLSVLLTIYLSFRNVEKEIRIPSLKSIITHDKLTVILNDLDLNETNVNTHRGYATLNEINEQVYKPFGYEVVGATLPVPTLRMLNEPSCFSVFADWLKMSRKPQPAEPPKKIPEHFSDEFLLNGFAGFSEMYFNDHSTTGDSPRNWDRISEFMNYTKTQLGALANNKESESMYHAMNGYRLNKKRGVVIGSVQPWVEVMALKHGAKKVLTIDYNPLTIPNEFKNRLSSILLVDFANEWQNFAEKFDFAATFSSIEHSGLGRYGDPLDPIGDLREMLKIRCLLKNGGLLFLGVPFGTDAIQYNAHRIYGSIRLAMLFYGFDWLATYSDDSEGPIDLTTTRLHSKGLNQQTHYTVVLKKI